MTRNIRESVVPANSTLRAIVSVHNPAVGWVTNATVSITDIVDAFTGTAIAGGLPISCAYINDWQSWTHRNGRPMFRNDGNYAGVIPADLGLEAGKIYFGTISITSDGLTLEIREQIRVINLET
jgi:hypothetical protein